MRFQFLMPIIDRDSSECRAKWRVPREAAVITPRYRRALIRRDEIINLRYLDHPQESDDDAAAAAPYRTAYKHARQTFEPLRGSTSSSPLNRSIYRIYCRLYLPTIARAAVISIYRSREDTCDYLSFSVF